MPARPAELDSDLVWVERRSPARRAPALFLDRDGVIVEEVNYLHETTKTRLVDGAAAVIAEANRAGVHVVVITNQSGIGRGYYDWAAFHAVQAKMLADLAAANAHIDAVLACPHHRDAAAPYQHPEHPDRKPNPGMLLKAKELLDIALNISWVVGDRASDIEAGRRAGLAGGLHVLAGHGGEEQEMALALDNQSFQVLAAPSIKAALKLVLPRLAG